MRFARNTCYLEQGPHNCKLSYLISRMAFSKCHFKKKKLLWYNLDRPQFGMNFFYTATENDLLYNGLVAVLEINHYQV